MCVVCTFGHKLEVMSTGPAALAKITRDHLPVLDKRAAHGLFGANLKSR